MKTIPRFPDYQVTEDGRVWSTERIDSRNHKRGGHWMKQSMDRYGYPQVVLSRDGSQYTQKIHRLVLETFIGPCPEDMECCHNNGDRTDNRLENLRWDTTSGNRQDAVRHGTCSFCQPGFVHARGEQRGNSKLVELDVRWIDYLARAGVPRKDLAEVYDVTSVTIGNIARHQTWTHLWA